MAGSAVRRLLLTEMCARVVKKRLESGWRALADLEAGAVLSIQVKTKKLFVLYG